MGEVDPYVCLSSKLDITQPYNHTSLQYSTSVCVSSSAFPFPFQGFIHEFLPILLFVFLSQLCLINTVYFLEEEGGKPIRNKEYQREALACSQCTTMH